MNSLKATKNFLHALDNAVNENLEKAAEKKGIAIQELIMVFQESGWQKDDHNNQMILEAILKKHGRVAVVSENNMDKPVCLSVPN